MCEIDFVFTDDALCIFMKDKLLQILFNISIMHNLNRFVIASEARQSLHQVWRSLAMTSYTIKSDNSFVACLLENKRNPWLFYNQYQLITYECSKEFTQSNYYIHNMLINRHIFGVSYKIIQIIVYFRSLK